MSPEATSLSLDTMWWYDEDSRRFFFSACELGKNPVAEIGVQIRLRESGANAPDEDWWREYPIRCRDNRRTEQRSEVNPELLWAKRWHGVRAYIPCGSGLKVWETTQMKVNTEGKRRRV
jgi:hypothetical protein